MAIDLLQLGAAAGVPVTSVMTHFADLPDPRSPLGRRHVLTDLLTIAICAVVCGADGWVQVEEFAHCKRKWFETFLDLPYGIPSHDTFGRVLARLDPAAALAPGRQLRRRPAPGACWPRGGEFLATLPGRAQLAAA